MRLAQEEAVAVAATAKSWLKAAGILRCLSTPVAEGQTVSIIPAVAGG